jgi:trigger factor
MDSFGSRAKFAIDIRNPKSKIKTGATLDVKIIPAEKCKRYIEVTMPAEEVEARVTATLRKYQKQLQLHGFRKGKAPLQLVKQIYGSAIRQETIDEMIPAIISEARDKNGLKTVGPANLEDKKYDEQNGLSFRASVEVAPEVELRNYKGLELEKTLFDVEDQDVAEAIEGLREQAAIMRVVDGEVQPGYYVVADFQRVDAAGFPIIGNKHEDQRLQVTSENEFTKPLIGARVGDSRRVSIAEKRPDGTAAEQPAFYQVTVKEIAEKILTALDDAFAKNLNFTAKRGDQEKKIETLEELKQAIRDELSTRAEHRSRENLRNELIDELLKINAFDLPEALAETYVQKFAESMKAQFAGLPEEMLNNEGRAAAMRRLRWDFLRARIAEVEGIEVGDEEMREYLIATALSSKQEPQRLINQTMHNAERREKLRGEMRETKTLHFLESQMKIRERHAPYKDRGQSRIIKV